MKEKIIEQVIKECFWDYSICRDEIDFMLASDDMRVKQRLFDKIINNSTKKIISLSLFDHDDLPTLFDNVKLNPYHKRLTIIKLALENILLGRNHFIKELAWRR
jgi:hypothetical protein